MNKAAQKADERFWGHAGVEFPNTPDKRWFPISQAEASRLEQVVYSGRRLSGWLAVETLNNRMLLLNPAQWECFSLLDDVDDWPAGDFFAKSGLDDYAGLPTELYRRIAEWADGDDDFKRNNSASKKKEALSVIERGGFLDRGEELHAFLRHTVIHYMSGKTKSFEANRADLYDLIEIEGDADAGTVKISQSNGAKHSYSLDLLLMIDIPMIELDAARAEVAGNARMQTILNRPLREDCGRWYGSMSFNPALQVTELSV